MMKFIALLPMKENSERIPQKNYRPLVGKPLFYYIADTLKATGIFENLVINTDSTIIAEMANKRYSDWVIIHERPAEIQGDFVSMYNINEYDISIFGDEFHYLQTHSTNPLLNKSTITLAVNKYKFLIDRTEYDSLFTVNEIKNRLYSQEMKPINHDPSTLIRSQDMKSVYEENSNLYIFNYKSFYAKNNRLGVKAYPFIMNSDSFESLDIDYLIDWKLAEIVIREGLLK